MRLWIYQLSIDRINIVLYICICMYAYMNINSSSLTQLNYWSCPYLTLILGLLRVFPPCPPSMEERKLSSIRLLLVPPLISPLRSWSSPAPFYCSSSLCSFCLYLVLPLSSYLIHFLYCDDPSFISHHHSGKRSLSSYFFSLLLSSSLMKSHSFRTFFSKGWCWFWSSFQARMKRIRCSSHLHCWGISLTRLNSLGHLVSGLVGAKEHGSCL